MIKNYNRVKNTRKNSGVASYAKVVTGTCYDEGGIREYSVVKYRDGTYGCTCKARLFRRNTTCIHIKEFVNFEYGIKNNT